MSTQFYINAWFKCDFSANINVLFSHLLRGEAHIKYDHPIKVCSIKLILMYNINDRTSLFCLLQKVAFSLKCMTSFHLQRLCFFNKLRLHRSVFCAFSGSGG